MQMKEHCNAWVYMREKQSERTDILAKEHFDSNDATIGRVLEGIVYQRDTGYIRRYCIVVYTYI